MEIQPSARQPAPAIPRILEAAAECFGRSGYRGASMQDIANAAGVAKSLLHYHFDSKEQIFLEVQLGLYRSLLDRIRRVVAEGTGSFAHFRTALGAVYDDVEENVDRVQAILELRHIDSGEVRDRVRAFHDEVILLIVEGIEDTLGDLVERLVIPSESLARQLLIFLGGILVNLSFAETEAEREWVRETFESYQMLLERSLLQDLS